MKKGSHEYVSKRARVMEERGSASLPVRVFDAYETPRLLLCHNNHDPSDHHSDFELIDLPRLFPPTQGFSGTCVNMLVRGVSGSEFAGKHVMNVAIHIKGTLYAGSTHQASRVTLMLVYDSASGVDRSELPAFTDILVTKHIDAFTNINGHGRFRMLRRMEYCVFGATPEKDEIEVGEPPVTVEVPIPVLAANTALEPTTPLMAIGQGGMHIVDEYIALDLPTSYKDSGSLYPSILEGSLLLYAFSNLDSLTEELVDGEQTKFYINTRLYFRDLD